MKDAMSRALLLLVAAGGLGFGPSSASAQHTRPAVDAGAILARADTFAILVGDERIGTQIVSVTRHDDMYVFQEETETPLGRQKTVVNMSPDLTMRSVRQSGTMAGQEMVIDVTYEGGRAVGRARIPRRAGVEDVEVASPVPGNVIDDNALVGLIPGMRLRLDERLRVPVFQSGRNRLVEYTLTVEDAGTVEVPSGAYSALRVEAAHGDSSIGFLVRAEAPHRVLAVNPPGGPLRLVRVGPR